jgi:hypothetical protein
MNEQTSAKILWTADVIAAYCKMSKKKFYRLVTAGFPACIIDGQWCAHTENIDEYFKFGTRKPAPIKPGEIPEDEEE